MTSQRENNPHFEPHYLELPHQGPRWPSRTPGQGFAPTPQPDQRPRRPSRSRGPAFTPTPFPPDRLHSPPEYHNHPQSPPDYHAHDTSTDKDYDSPHFAPPQPRPVINPKARSHGRQGGGMGTGYDSPPVRPPQPRSNINPKARGHGKQGGAAVIPPPGVHFGEPGPHTPEYHQQGLPPSRHPSSFRQTNTRETKPLAWLVAAFCALFWIIIIVGGLLVLIIYLIYRPHLPKFDISAASLNAAYLDVGYLLNADVTILGNFTNPNKKVNVDFRFVLMDLYFENNLIATRFIEPFTILKRESLFETVHMVTSQVRISFFHSQELMRQIGEGRVTFEVRGLYRARSDLGGLLKFSYWLYTHCTITVTSPPSGVLVGKKCTTKRK